MLQIYTDGRDIISAAASYMLNDIWQREGIANKVRAKGLFHPEELSIFVLDNMQTILVTIRESGEVICEARLDKKLRRSEHMGLPRSVKEELDAYARHGAANAGDYAAYCVFASSWDLAD